MASNHNFYEGERDVKEAPQNFWDDSKLMLRNVTKENGGRNKHEYLWIIDNYDKIDFGIFYQSQRIVVGKVEHYLCFKRMKLSSKSDSNPKKIGVKIIMKLIPPLKRNQKLMFDAMDYSKMFHICYYCPVDEYYFINEEPYLTFYAKLQIVFSITLNESIKISVHQPLAELKNYLILSDDLDGLLIGGEYSDIRIIVGHKEFKVHRCILASRSKVFAKMLEVDMMGKNTGQIIIEDCPSEIFYNFLMYLYSGKVILSSVETALKLLELGEKYSIRQLKSDAASYLSQNLNFCNAIDLYKQSEMFNIPELKIAAKQFISLYLEEVINDSDCDIILSSDCDSLLDSLIPSVV